MLKPILKILFKLLLSVAFRLRIRGDMNPLRAQRLLIIANHESFLDGLLLGVALPIDPVFIVHTGIAKNRWFRLLFSHIDFLAVDPTNPMAMKKIIKLVESGRPVVIFPEGRITTTGSMMKIYEGPAFVAAKTQATIVPIRLDGLTRSYFSRMVGNYPRYLFPRITMSIQAAAHLSVPSARTAKLRRR